ncbi:hypothetical protein E2C01_069632 [Portunus trituberculatus]|uniref:Uncharacterized protein n=1 Tax=Portunus trituberculatus TaxID=210409 RepID=A0A5B7I2U9_PORTR|nr:hypothetical protein [Portunus trituberculatus]
MKRDFPARWELYEPRLTPESGGERGESESGGTLLRSLVIISVAFENSGGLRAKRFRSQCYHPVGGEVSAPCSFLDVVISATFLHPASPNVLPPTSSPFHTPGTNHIFSSQEYNNYSRIKMVVICVNLVNSLM